jgi:hypothetical protein
VALKKEAPVMAVTVHALRTWKVGYCMYRSSYGGWKYTSVNDGPESAEEGTDDPEQLDKWLSDRTL